jgi:hypothetical protein
VRVSLDLHEYMECIVRLAEMVKFLENACRWLVATSTSRRQKPLSSEPTAQELHCTCIKRCSMPCLLKKDDFRRFAPHQVRRPHFRVFGMQMPTRSVSTYYTDRKLCTIGVIDVWMESRKYSGCLGGLHSLPGVVREGTNNT